MSLTCEFVEERFPILEEQLGGCIARLNHDEYRMDTAIVGYMYIGFQIYLFEDGRGYILGRPRTEEDFKNQTIIQKWYCRLMKDADLKIPLTNPLAWANCLALHN